MGSNDILISVDVVTHNAIATVFTQDFGMILLYFMRRRNIIPLSVPVCSSSPLFNFRTFRLHYNTLVSQRFVGLAKHGLKFLNNYRKFS